MIKNVLLTGGTGFLGSHILKGLLKEQYNVIVLVRNSSKLNRIDYLKERVEFFYIDENMTNLDDLFSKFQIDAVIHTATEYGRNCQTSKILQSNLIFPIKLIESGIRNELKLFINSDTFFGKPLFKDLSYLNQYTTSKKFFLDYLTREKGNLKVVNMRLEHIFGENDSDSKFVTNIMHQLMRDEALIKLTDGTQKRDFIYICDVVSAYLKVLLYYSQLKSFKEFEVGRGESIDVRQFVEMLSEEIGSQSKLKFGALSARTGEIQDSKAILSDLNEFGWEPKYKIQDAIQRMVELERINFEKSN